jgi:aryl-alcohol dehydrogenase
MTKARAAIVHAKGQPFTLEDVELDAPRANEVLVRIVGAGICHTDLIARDQYYPVPLPAVFGHEGCGVVEHVGTGVTKVQPGDHVVLTYLSCGVCANCQRGRPPYCFDLFRLNFGGARADGSAPIRRSGGAVHGAFFSQSSFSTYALATERNVVKVRKDAPLEILGPLGCGIQTGAGAVMNALRPEAGSSLAVFGTGSVGLSAVMAAKAVGCTTIIAVDMKSNRLALAQELGATHAVNAAEKDTAAEIQRITGSGVMYSLELTAQPRVLRQAVDVLIPSGVCGVIGAPPMGTEVNLDINTILLGRTVRGIIEGDSIPDIFIPHLVELHGQGRFPFDRLISTFPLDQINQAAAASERGEVIKPVLRVQS